MSSALNNFATAVSAHTGTVSYISPKPVKGVTNKRVGFDPMSIIMMLSTILPPILETFRNCKKKREEAVDPVALRTHVSTNMSRIATCTRQEGAMAKEIDAELQRQKKMAIKASKGGGVIPDFLRFDLGPASRQRLAHNIIGKFATCSDQEAIDLIRDADTQMQLVKNLRTAV